MRSRAVPAAILAVLASIPAARRASGSGKSRTIRFTAGTVAVRAVVPEVFESLLPGSIYPNRRKAKPWSAGPVAIVEKSLASRAERELLARGFLVAEVESIDAATVDAVAAGLARRIEGAASRERALEFDPPVRRSLRSAGIPSRPLVLRLPSGDALPPGGGGRSPGAGTARRRRLRLREVVPKRRRLSGRGVPGRGGMAGRGLAPRR
jgi:hypothetical protein